MSQSPAYTLKTLAAAAALWIGWSAAGGNDPAARRAAPTTTSPAAPRARPLAKTDVFHGMAIQLHTGEDCWNRYSPLIPQIADLGADTVMIVVHAYQDHAGSMDLRIHGTKTARDEDLARLIDFSHQYGLRVILMPIVLLEYPRGTEWRGRIKPPDLDAWFQRYTDFILRYARMAERRRVELLMIGSELIMLESSTQRWRRLIQEVKQFYRGKLGYSANWDHYRPIEFWDDLDYIGMTSYYKLADAPAPTVDEVVQAWQPFRRDILDFQREVRKPIIFTEIGWCSQEGAAVEAWNYYRMDHATPAGLEEQATLYDAFIRVWEDTPGVAGYICWEWTPDPGGDKDFGYTPRGKPAEKLIRQWFARKAAAGRRPVFEGATIPDAPRGER